MKQKKDIDSLFNWLAEHEKSDREDKKELLDRLDQFMVSIKDDTISSPVLLEIKSELQNFRQEVKETLKNHEERIKKNESIIAKFTAIMFTIGSVVAITWTVLGDWVKESIRKI